MNRCCIGINIGLLLLFLLLLFVAMQQKEECVAAPIHEPTHRANTTELTLIFAGDLMQHTPQVAAATDKATGSIDYADCFARIKPFFQQADFVVVNLETTLGEAPYLGYPRFRSPKALAWNMREAGMDVALLANNHICDQKHSGLIQTVEALERAGVPYTGAFADSAAYRKRNPLFLNQDGFRIALLNYTYGTNGMPIPKGTIVNLIDTVQIRSDIARAKALGATTSAVLIHWGDEYVRLPNKTQRTLAAFCHRAGADLVIGSHPHVVQPMEVIEDAEGNTTGVTVYSLGNFVSNQRREDTDGGIAVRITLSRTGEEHRITGTEYLIHWTEIAADPTTRSGKSYRITPSYASQELHPSARPAFNRFITRTREHMERHSNGFKEIKYEN